MTYFRNYMQNCRQRWLSGNEKLTASGASLQPPPSFRGYFALNLLQGLCSLAPMGSPQIKNPPFQNPGSTTV